MHSDTQTSCDKQCGMVFSGLVLCGVLLGLSSYALANTPGSAHEQEKTAILSTCVVVFALAEIVVLWFAREPLGQFLSQCRDVLFSQSAVAVTDNADPMQAQATSRTPLWTV